MKTLFALFAFMAGVILAHDMTGPYQGIWVYCVYLAEWQSVGENGNRQMFPRNGGVIGREMTLDEMVHELDTNGKGGRYSGSTSGPKGLSDIGNMDVKKVAGELKDKGYRGGMELGRLLPGRYKMGENHGVAIPFDYISGQILTPARKQRRVSKNIENKDSEGNVIKDEKGNPVTVSVWDDGSPMDKIMDKAIQAMQGVLACRIQDLATPRLRRLRDWNSKNSYGITIETVNEENEWGGGSYTTLDTYKTIQKNMGSTPKILEMVREWLHNEYNNSPSDAGGKTNKSRFGAVSFIGSLLSDMVGQRPFC